MTEEKPRPATANNQSTSMGNVVTLKCSGVVDGFFEILLYFKVIYSEKYQGT